MSFSGYVPNEGYPSQSFAKLAAQRFLSTLAHAPRTDATRRWRRERRRGLTRDESGDDAGSIYFDGGFGVGKTHLLVSLYNECREPKAYLSFSDLTYFVGAVGFQLALEHLRALTLITIDEFELDDPGDTVMVANLCHQLVVEGVRLAATSNTLPDRLGEERFAADDFQREIGALAREFSVITIDGPDYRQRQIELHNVEMMHPGALDLLVRESGFELVEFQDLTDLLARVHPAKYRALLSGVDCLAIRGVTTLDDHYRALRFVAFVDRLYELDVRVALSGIDLEHLYPRTLLQSGYRKKYGRALSRLVALITETPASYSEGRDIGA